MSSVFEVLAEPTRRRILDSLLGGERHVAALVGELGLAQPSVSKHLHVLRDAGLVRVRRDGQRRWYSVRAEPLLELEAWLAPYRQLRSDLLDAPQRHLDVVEDD